jgi:hypothetical protein
MDKMGLGSALDNVTKDATFFLRHSSLLSRELKGNNSFQIKDIRFDGGLVNDLRQPCELPRRRDANDWPTRLSMSGIF